MQDIIQTRKKKRSGRKRLVSIAKRYCLPGLLAALAVSLAGCGKKSPLDPKNPVSLTIWHYYNGSQQVAFDSLVEEFNDTVGREKGIYVQGYSQGSVSDLETAVRDAIAGKVGADVMPDIFLPMQIQPMKWSRQARWPICRTISARRSWMGMWILT